MHEEANNDPPFCLPVNHGREVMVKHRLLAVYKVECN